MGSVSEEEALPPPPKRATVLVTGFGPFQQKFPVNPSFEIARSLPERVLSSPGIPIDIDIITYGSPIRVSYEDVRELIPKMHEAYSGTIDLVLHIGMASGRNYYAVERFAHRDGYDRNKDVDGQRVPSEEGKLRFGDCPTKMTSSLDVDDVWMKWESNLLTAPEAALPNDPDEQGPTADVRISDNAGRYLCDYIYFNSLAWFGRRSGQLEGGRGSDRPVLFLHVPPESDPDTIAKGRVITTALIQAMVDCWSTNLQSRP